MKRYPVTHVENPAEPLSATEKTRHSLLLAGLKLFGEYGLNGTTTRMLSKEAQANVSAISYHFGSKVGLYLAVAEFIAQRMRHHTSLMYEQASILSIGHAMLPKEAGELLAKLLHSYFSFLFTTKEVYSWVQFMLRELTAPTEAFALLYDQHIRYVFDIISQLVAKCCHISPNSSEAKIRAQALLSQVLGFFITQNALCKLLGKSTLMDEHREMMKSLLDMHLSQYLQHS